MSKMTTAVVSVLMVIAIALWLVRPVEAGPTHLSVQDALGALVPISYSSGCKNKVMAALAPTLVASGTALHAANADSKVYDVSVADNDAVAGTCSDCWFRMTSGETVATGTGRHIPRGAISVWLIRCWAAARRASGRDWKTWR